MTTKQRLVQEALAEIGLSSYEFDLSADQLEQALFRLDAMLAEWGRRGIRIGFPIPASPGDSTAATDTGLPDWCREAVISNLAVRLAPSYGKTVNPATAAAAVRSMAMLYSDSAKPQELRPGMLPSGAGNKNEPFMPYQENDQLERPEPSVLFE